MKQTERNPLDDKPAAAFSVQMQQSNTFPRSAREGHAPPIDIPKSNSTHSLNQWGDAPEPPIVQSPARRVYLRRVVQDAYEFHGLKDLAIFMFFAVVVSLVLYFHWSGTSAAFRTTVQQSFVNYGDDDWAQAQLFSTDDITEGLQYLTEYLRFHIQRSQEIGLTGGTVRIHDMAQVYFARVLVNVERSCQVEDLPCYYRDNPAGGNLNLLDMNPAWITQNSSQLDSRSSLNARTPWKSLAIIWDPQSDSNPGGMNISTFLHRLNMLTDPATSRFIGQFAYSVVVDLFATSVLKPKDSAIFTVNVQRSLQPRARIATPLYKTTTTLPARKSFYRFHNDRNDAIRLAFEITFLALFLYQWRKLYRTMAICWAQYKHVNKWRWFMYVWNDYELLCMLAMLIWTIYYVVLVILLEKRFIVWPPKNDHDMNEIVDLASNYSDWLWGCIGIMTGNSLRLVRYMRIHSGLKAFYMVFVLAMNQFIDFAVFLIYIILLLGSAIFAFFQITGGNAQFLQFGDGLSVMARLGFNLATYQEFQNGALGLGAATSSVTVLFWISVILLFVYAQNIILAIVAHSYDQAKHLVGKAETSFPVLVFQRFIFTGVSIYHELHNLRNHNDGPIDPPDTPSAEALNLAQVNNDASVASEDHTDRERTLSGDDEGARMRAFGSRRRSMSSPPRKALNFTRRSGTLIRQLMQAEADHQPAAARPVAVEKKVKKHWWDNWARAHWARWALVRNQEILALVALYHDFATLTLKRKPVWDLQPYRGHTEPLPGQAGPGATDGGWDFPDLELEVTEEELRALLKVLHVLAHNYNHSPNPFRPMDDHGLVDALTIPIMEIYTKSKHEEVAKVIEKAQDLPAPQLVLPREMMQGGPPYPPASILDLTSRRPSVLTMGGLMPSASMPRSSILTADMGSAMPWAGGASMRRTFNHSSVTQVVEEMERQEMRTAQEALTNGISMVQEQLRRLEASVSASGSRQHSPPRGANWQGSERPKSAPLAPNRWPAPANVPAPPLSRSPSLARSQQGQEEGDPSNKGGASRPMEVEILDRLARQEEATTAISQQLQLQHQLLAQIMRHLASQQQTAVAAAGQSPPAPVPRSSSRSRTPDRDPLLTQPPS